MAKSNVDPHALKAVKSATNLLEKEFYFAKLTSTGECELASTGEAAYAITEGAEAGGYSTLVFGAERQKVIIGGTVAIGNNLTVNSEGKGVKEVGEGVIVAVALEAGLAGDIIEALMCVPVTKA
jgi:hypothetical protein